MYGRIGRGSKSRHVALICVLIAFAAVRSAAQDSQGNTPAGQATPTPQVQPTPSQVQPARSQVPARSLEHHFFGNILRDQRAIWTSPFHAGHGDAKWLAPLGLSAAVLFATDRRTAGELAEDDGGRTRARISRDISQGGSIYAMGGIAAAFYLAGRAGHNARAREAGLLGAEALVDGGIVVEALKLVTQRSRPLFDDSSGEFFEGGNSFPSGHSISVWSLATVFAHEYGRRRPLVRVGVYGLATAVSLSRYTARKHFLSDVLVGSALGYGIGRYVYHKNHDPSLDATDGGPQSDNASKSGDESPAGDKPQAGDEAKSGGGRSRLLPLVAPRFSRAERTYGLTLAWAF
ncbi:MAG: hypothetical protein QOJ76_2236 [Acidobacteriota bacterium]|nr:hypothetical protein [Acidobacteriota bacterium]